MSDNSNASSPSTGPAAPSNTAVETNNTQNTQASNDVIDTTGSAGDSDYSSDAEIDADSSLTKEEKKIEKKKLKQLEIKFNGKPSKVDLPFEIDEEHAEWMRRQLQMGKMGQQKAQDYAALERDIMSFLHELQTNPRKAFSNPAYGVDLRKIAVEMIEEELANAQKTPEELEREEYKRKLKEYEEKEAAREKQMKELERQQKVEAAYAQYDAAMVQTMEKFNLPNEPIAVYEMAHLMALEIKRGFEPDMDSIGEMVSEKLNGGYASYLKKLPHDKLVNLLGNDVFENERKARVAKVKKAPVQPKSAVQDVAKQEPKKEEPAKKMTYKERFGL